MFRSFLQSAWTRWNSHIPAGRYACLRLYNSYKASLHLFQNVPGYQVKHTYSPVCTWILMNGGHNDSIKMLKAELSESLLPGVMPCMIVPHTQTHKHACKQNYTTWEKARINCNWITMSAF